MSDRLYALLPSVYRLRDAEQGEPLRALLRVMEHELEAVEADIDGLYEDLFIETAAEWAVPYLGDLLAVRRLQPIVGGVFSERAYIANTLAYRRRKGTAPIIEQLARDVSGWTARAVEMFDRLGTTQHLDHQRRHNTRTPDLRRSADLERFAGPFETANHTAEVRRIASHRGRYNISNIAVHLWRLQPYSMVRSTPRPVSDPADGRYFMHPLGLDTPLFNRPRSEDTITGLAQEIHVPAPLRHRPLHAELEALRQARVDGAVDPPLAYFAADRPVVSVYVDGAEIPGEELLICHLDTVAAGAWRRPPSEKTYLRSDGTPVARPIRAAIDPRRGRLAFPDGVVPGRVEVSWAYGFPGDVGGGPYDRRATVEAELDRVPDWQVGVTESADPALDEVATLDEAVAAWNAQQPGTFGVITLLDNATYVAPATEIRIADGSRLYLVAADWPLLTLPSGAVERPPGRLSPIDRRPHVLGNLQVRGLAPPADGTYGRLAVDGALIEGSLQVNAGHLGSLTLRHCTLAPRQGTTSLAVATTADGPNDRLLIELERSICGAIGLPEPVPELRVVDSLIDAAGGDLDDGSAIDAPTSRVEIATSTVIGSTRVRRIAAEQSIFGGRLRALRRQEGCVRFCWLPFTEPADDTPPSRTPRRYRCQPDLAVAAALEALRDDGPVTAADIAAARRRVLSRVRPLLTSLDFTHPGAAQLRHLTPAAIRTGAENGSEMGVWSHLAQPQREANLRTALEDTLRVGLEAGLFFVT